MGLGKGLTQNPITHKTHTALLIRLQTNSHLIEYYNKTGKLKEAELEKTKQVQKNREIIKNFINEWTLTPVYFFYSNHSNEIKNGELKHLFKGLSQLKLTENEENALRENYIVGFFGQTTRNLKFHALILTNHKFQNIQRPFPKYIRTYKGLWFLKRKTKRIIQILNKKLEFHYSRIQ